jgi:DivIVA domain-containing protein
MGKKDKATQEQSFAGPAVSSASSILGPLDVQQKEFSVARFGGYKMRDVDEFLDRITDSMSALTVENERLRSGAPASILGTPDLADVARQADEIIERARAEASRIVAEAKATGAQPGAAAVSPQDRAAVTAFLTREREFLQSLAGLVQEHAEQVRGMAKTAKRAPTTPAAATKPQETATATPAAADPESSPPVAEAAAPPAAAATDAPPEPKPAEPRAEPRKATPEATVRIEEPEPASVGRSESEADAPPESDRSLRDLFWGED